MRTFNENENIEILNEAVMERHLLAFIKQLSKDGLTLKDVFGKVPDFNIAEMDASRVKVYDYVDDKLMKDIKKKIKALGYIFFGILDDKVTIVLIYNRDIIFVPFRKQGGDSTYTVQRENPLYYNVYASDSKTVVLDKKVDALSKCDEIWEFKMNNKDFGLYGQRVDRREAQEDVWDNSPEFYAKWIEKNRKKYIAELAKIHASKTIDIAKLTKRLSDLSSKITDLLADLSKNMNKYAQDCTYNNICQQLPQSLARIFNKMSLLVDYQRDLTLNKEYTNPEYTKNNLEKTYDIIMGELDVLEQNYNKAVARKNEIS